MNIIEGMESPRVLARLFRDQETWRSWKVFLKALFNLEMTKEELEIFRSCTDLENPYPGKIREAWVLVGRRGGKSSIASLLAVYLGLFKDWSEFLSPGERPYIYALSVTKFQARTVKDYVIGALESNTSLRKMIEIERAWDVDLKNGLTISCLPCSYRGIRGKTVVCAILEEICFWRWEAESAVQDVEVIRALRPSMGTIPESLMIAISSPYIAQGVMAKKMDRYYGKPGPILCWKAPTLTMNPTFSEEEIKEAYQDDPEAAASEYGGEWRKDISGAIPPEVIDAAVVPKRFELDYVSETKYVGAIDPSGARSDSFTMSITHKEERRIIVDLLREAIPPFKPENVVKDFSKIFKKYGITEIQSDRYAGEWVSSAFRDQGIEVIKPKASKSEFYLEVIPLLNNGYVELLDNSRLKSQFKSLQRRTRSGGKDLVDNFLPGGHDDVSNVCAIGCVTVAQGDIDLPGDVYKPGRATSAREEIQGQFGFLSDASKEFRESLGPDAKKVEKGFLKEEKKKTKEQPKEPEDGKGWVYTEGG